MNEQIPDDVSATLMQALEGYQLTLEQDPGLADMGGPTEEEVEEALKWLRGEGGEQATPDFESFIDELEQSKSGHGAGDVSLIDNEIRSLKQLASTVYNVEVDE